VAFSRSSGKRFASMLENSKQIQHLIQPAKSSSVSQADFTAKCGCACDGAEKCAGFAVRASASLWVCYLVSETASVATTVLDVTSYHRTPAVDDTCHIKSSASSVAEMIELVSHFQDPVSGKRWSGASEILQKVQSDVSDRNAPMFKVGCLRSCCSTQHCNAAYIEEGRDTITCRLFKKGAAEAGLGGPNFSTLMYGRQLEL
jgi:hypothetical protein